MSNENTSNESQRPVKQKKKLFSRRDLRGLTKYVITSIVSALVTAIASYQFIIKVNYADAVTTSEDNPNTHYTKKFLFWTPKFEDSTALFDTPELTEKNFIAKLRGIISPATGEEFGYSRWKVEGYWTRGGMRSDETGWYYEVATKHSNIESDFIVDNVLKLCWTQESWYITETPLKYYKRDAGFYIIPSCEPKKINEAR